MLHVAQRAGPKPRAAGYADPADRRNRLLHALVDLWQRDPPSYRIVAAGSTGTIPAVAKLLKCVANLPAGKVILPGPTKRSMKFGKSRRGGPDTPQFGMLSCCGTSASPSRRC